nr:transporter substrate-binding domain-containing protein [Leekyejoonella antrihumi]
MVVSACGGSGAASQTPGASPGASGSKTGNCHPKHQFSTLKSGVLTVGFTDLPPWTIPQGNTAAGVEGVILEKIAKMECLSTVLKTESGGSGIADLTAGRLDMTSGAYYRTKQRAEVANLSSPLYLDELGLLSKGGVCTIPAMKGKTVGTIQGYLWVSDLQNLFGSDVHLYQSSSDALQDVLAGRIQVDADSYGTMSYLQRTTSRLKGFKICVPPPDKAVAASELPAQIGFPMAKKNTAMLNAFNSDIQELHKDGFIKKALVKYGLAAKAADTGSPRLIGS